MDFKNKNISRLRHWISAPFIFSVIIPIIIFDIWMEIYHRVCFPLYGLPYVKRNHYISVDRHRLKYLNFLEKLFCAYCGYGNGVLHYWSRIAADTERYWCGIKHKSKKNFIPLEHHKNFAEYNNQEDLQKKYGPNKN